MNRKRENPNERIIRDGVHKEKGEIIYKRKALNFILDSLIPHSSSLIFEMITEFQIFSDQTHNLSGIN